MPDCGCMLDCGCICMPGMAVGVGLDWLLALAGKEYALATEIRMNARATGAKRTCRVASIRGGASRRRMHDLSLEVL